MSRAVSVVVPAHGTADQLAPLVRSLADQVEGDPLTVVVVDDASDPPLWLPSPPGLDLRVVRRDANGGPGAARNTGLAEVTTPWIAYLDADVVPAPHWLERLTDLVAAPDAPDLIEGRARIPAEPPPTPFTHATEIAPPEQRGAGNVVFRTEVLRAAGGFDERFYDRRRGVHFREDTELALRLEEAGRTTQYEPELIVDHPLLPPTFWGPVKLARRYEMDPLLSKLHPGGFRAMNQHRKVGPISLRRARHDASVALVLGVVVALVGLGVGWWSVALVGGLLALAGWAATAVALAWRRTVRPGHVLPLIVVSFVVPWVYLWGWWRGVVRWRHRPRL